MEKVLFLHISLVQANSAQIAFDEQVIASSTSKAW